MNAAWVLTGALLCGCTGGSRQVDKPTGSADESAAGSSSEGSANVKMTSNDQGGTFVRGPSVAPGDKLIAWLDQQQRNGEPRLVRLPVILQKGQVGFSTRGARIGTSADAVEVYLMDAALGIGVENRARSQCKGAPQCAMWLEGYWRGKQEGAYQFDVTRVVSAIEPGGLAAASYAEVEGESGN